MPRPRLSDHERRTKRVTASVSPSEWNVIQERSERAQMSVPEYLRQRAVRDRLQIESPRRLDAKTFREVQRLGVNVNQIARALNRGLRPGQSLPRVLKQLLDLLEKLLPEEPD